MQEDGDQGALIGPESVRGSLQTSASRCAHTARVKQWTSERGLGESQEAERQNESRGEPAMAKRRRRLIPGSYWNCPV